MSRIPSVGGLQQTRAYSDGNMAVGGAVRGPICRTRPSLINGYGTHVRDVLKAFWLGATKYARAETVRKLGSDMQDIINSLWPGFEQAIEIYAGCIGSGAVGFGIAGAIFGGGVGAAPAAVAGAELGTVVATEILMYMGIKCLGEYVLSHLDEADRAFQAGFVTAWSACGNSATIELAAHQIALGFADLMSLLLEAGVAWLLKKGLKAGMEELKKSETGRIIGSYARVEYWRKKLGITGAPIPRAGLKTAIEFIDEKVDDGALPREKFTDENDLAGYFRAMDFSKPVERVTLSPGMELVAYRLPETYGYYYAEVGSYLDKLGVDYVTGQGMAEGAAGPLPERKFVRYRVKVAVEVLKSTASAVRAWDTDKSVSGGATQYFIPQSWNLLEIVPKKK